MLLMQSRYSRLFIRFTVCIPSSPFAAVDGDRREREKRLSLLSFGSELSCSFLFLLTKGMEELPNWLDDLRGIRKLELHDYIERISADIVGAENVFTLIDRCSLLMSYLNLPLP